MMTGLRAATGLGPGNEGGSQVTFELSYLLFASRFLLSPHFLCSSISIRWDTCLFLPRHILPFHTNLQQGFEMKRKKRHKMQKNQSHKKKHLKRSQDVPIMCCLNNSNTMWRVKRAENNPHILNKVLLICFLLGSSSQTSVSIRITHEGCFYKNLLALPPEFQI